MMVLIKRDGPDGRELLMARSGRFARGMYSALAGFVEPSESIEECIHREAFEEVGVKVRNLKYYSSQGWPFPNSAGRNLLPRAGGWRPNSPIT